MRQETPSFDPPPAPARPQTPGPEPAPPQPGGAPPHDVPLSPEHDALLYDESRPLGAKLPLGTDREMPSRGVGAGTSAVPEDEAIEQAELDEALGDTFPASDPVSHVSHRPSRG